MTPTGKERMTATVEEAAQPLGIGRTLAYQLVHDGRLPSIRLGRRVLIPRTEIQRLLQSEVTGGADTGAGSASSMAPASNAASRESVRFESWPESGAAVVATFPLGETT